MSTNVELKHSVVASKGFVQAVQRLSECRTLNLKDHAATIKLCKLVQNVVDKLRAEAEKGDEHLTSELDKTCSLEACGISRGAITQAGLSPQDCMALEEIIGE
jgi:hypothetical protein